MPVKKKRPTKKKTPVKKSGLNWTIVLYGPNGIGKTSLCAHLPSPHFIIDFRERGIVKLSDRRLVPDPVDIRVCRDWKQVLAELNPARIPREAKTVVVESITGLQNLCFDYAMRKRFDGNKDAFYQYFRGPKQTAEFDWPDMIDGLQEIEEAGFNVVLTGHSRIKPSRDPEVEDYDRNELICESAVWEKTKSWSSAILFFKFVVEIDKGKKGMKAKARDLDVREIRTLQSPLYDAKNWLGLPEVIDGGSSAEEASENLLNALNR